MKRELYNQYIADGWFLFPLYRTEKNSKGLIPQRGWQLMGDSSPLRGNIIYGGVPPKNIIVVDVDVKNNKKGEQSLKLLEEELFEDLPTHIITPSGGRHIYLKLKKPRKVKKTDKRYPDIDFINHGSEFVILGNQTCPTGEYQMLSETYETHTINDLDFLEERAEIVSSDVDELELLSTRPEKEQIENILTNISADCDYTIWANVAMALHSWDNGGKEGLNLFTTWSQSARNHTLSAEELEEKYNKSRPKTKDFHHKLFGISNEISVTTFNEQIENSTELGELKSTAELVGNSTLNKQQKTDLVEKLCEKSKELTGKPNRVELKNLCLYNPFQTAISSEMEFPDMQKVGNKKKVLPTLDNLIYFMENYSDHRIEYDVILKRHVIDGKYDPEIGINTIIYALVRDEIIRKNLPVSLVSPHYWDSYLFHNRENNLLRYLESLPVWDKKTDYIAQLASTITTSLSHDYVREVLQSFLIQAVAAWDMKKRTKHKKRQLEQVLTFVGGQGIGKTTWVSALMPDFMGNFFKSGVELNPEYKDSYLEAIKAGLVELGELDATTKKSDISSLKAFLSKTEDEIRLPYGRSSERYARQTVFVGTVNNTDFLKDATGGRRFLLLVVEALETPEPDLVLNCWSQAFALYLANTNWVIAQKYEKQKQELIDEHTDVGEVEDIFNNLQQAIQISTENKTMFSISKITKSLGLTLSARGRSDLVALMQRAGHKRNKVKQYCLPADVITKYNQLQNFEQFENLEEDF